MERKTLPAHGGVISQDSNILPGGGMPVRVIVPLFWTLIPAAATIVVLTSVDGTTVTELFVCLQFAISNEQTCNEENRAC